MQITEPAQMGYFRDVVIRIQEQTARTIHPENHKITQRGNTKTSSKQQIQMTAAFRAISPI